MALVYWSLFCLSFPFHGSAQNIQIEAQPATVDLRQGDLGILCSVASPSQLHTVYIIQLLKNNSGPTLARVASVHPGSGGTDVIAWQDTTEQGYSNRLRQFTSNSTTKVYHT
ncbi:uncharacterized protein LOC125660941 [Ostrea edulis]|uniref:uncharacterized protein LOC125660941 n=1 Tax=Ostrea edulis TaxID=37623 RepID=UPI0024AF1A8B|nr:uncharacterized protein LOC125660941 [Ostrea edulis]